jgi:hypothetical protein
MATFTPTASSTAIAGASLWALVWTMVGHVDTLMSPFGLKNKMFTKRIRVWVNDHKGLSICMTEVVNLSHAGLSPLGTTFAIGGTFFNLFYIFCINPIICWRYRKENPLLVYSDKRKVAV